MPVCLPTNRFAAILFHLHLNKYPVGKLWGGRCIMIWEPIRGYQILGLLDIRESQDITFIIQQRKTQCTNFEKQQQKSSKMNACVLMILDRSKLQVATLMGTLNLRMLQISEPDLSNKQNKLKGTSKSLAGSVTAYSQVPIICTGLINVSIHIFLINQCVYL